MALARSQFVGGGYSGADFVRDSLDIMTADTRGGLDAIAPRLDAMTKYADGHPDQVNPTRLAGYVTKLTKASGTAQPAPKPVKPGSGMMG